MRSSRYKPAPPSLNQLQTLLGRQRTLGELVDFADGLDPMSVRPALRLMCSLLPLNGLDSANELRVWALFGALLTRYLFMIARIPADRDWPI